LDTKDVYDESYRKARKMDVDNFTTKFDPHALEIINMVRKGLLEGPNQNTQIEAELYKLNVYDEGSFFKAHKDTPRSEKMFASLIVSFPTSHQGGKLLLRHDGEEWAFDSAEILSKDKGSAAWVAFYSDIEHEVTPITSGYRLTLTYNLFYGADTYTPPDLNILNDSHFIFQSSPDISLLRTALISLLQDSRVLPNGGYFGFGLRFMYPAFGQNEMSSLQNLLTQLKGSASLLKQVCDSLSLSTTLEVFVEEDDIQMLVPATLDLSDSMVDSGLYQFLSEFGGRRVNNREKEPGSDDEETIMWVTPPTAFPTYDTTYVAYGNDASVSHLYGDVCLVAEVGPFERRETAGALSSRRKTHWF
ncbi:hypothetical protein BDN72DRAFT_766933, partial [Pluteus cervinus]